MDRGLHPRDGLGKRGPAEGGVGEGGVVEGDLVGEVHRRPLRQALVVVEDRAGRVEAGHQAVPEAVVLVVAADAVLVGVLLEHVLGPVRVVLEARQAVEQIPARVEDLDAGRDAAADVAQPRQDLSRAVHPVGVGGGKLEAAGCVLLRGRDAGVVLLGEDVGPGHEGPEPLGGDAVPREQRGEGVRVPPDQPAPLAVLAGDVDRAVAVLGQQIHRLRMDEPVVERGPDPPVGWDREGLDRVHVAPEGREVLPGRNIPVAVPPGPELPAGQAVQRAAVLGVLKTLSSTVAGMKWR